jgi:hypothetical protein
VPHRAEAFEEAAEGFHWEKRTLETCPSCRPRSTRASTSRLDELEPLLTEARVTEDKRRLLERALALIAGNRSPAPTTPGAKVSGGGCGRRTSSLHERVGRIRLRNGEPADRLRLRASAARTARPCGESILELTFQTRGCDVMLCLNLHRNLDPDPHGLKADDLHVVGHVLPVRMVIALILFKRIVTLSLPMNQAHSLIIAGVYGTCRVSTFRNSRTAAARFGRTIDRALETRMGLLRVELNVLHELVLLPRRERPGQSTPASAPSVSQTRPPLSVRARLVRFQGLAVGRGRAACSGGLCISWCGICSRWCGCWRGRVARRSSRSCFCVMSWRCCADRLAVRKVLLEAGLQPGAGASTLVVADVPASAGGEHARL